MLPFVTNGQVWRVVRVPVGDPRLVDRTGTMRLATTDPGAHEVRIRQDLMPPLLDKVMLHEAAHAVSWSHGNLARLSEIVARGDVVAVEELIANTVENYSIEALEAARTSLGRPVCVRGRCFD